MAAEIESKLEESSKLLVSSGGIFEVQDGDTLIYSKKETGRFPEDGEVLRIISNLDRGLSLEEARKEAARGIPEPPIFLRWLEGLMTKRKG